MEVAASVSTELALSGLSLVIKKLASNFGGDVTPDEMEHLNVFVGSEIEALIREAKSADLVKSAQLLEKLQAAALELEDLLDLYQYNQIKKQVISSSSSNPIKKFICKSKEKLGPILPKSPLRIGVEKLLKFVQQVEKKHPFIMSSKATTQPQSQPNPITPTTSILLSPYFGRENQCDNIIEFLLHESHANSSRWANNVPVVAIIGMGGSGKSHTAQRIFNDDRIKNYFDANMWVHVTRDFDVETLTRKMVESANNEKCPNYDNFDVLQKKLIESLSKRKRFLLVLDDVWCENKMNEWDLLVGPLNECAQNGSKVIITTRMENIASNLHAKKFHLEELKVEECWSVLKHYAFRNYEEIIDDQELINVGNQIISKVKHSPLALRVVGCSLSNKRSVNEWEKILKQDHILKETMDLLLFSYQCLPLHLQRCFAYCSLFPKGYEFSLYASKLKPRLISLWIAQGFIENTSESTLEEEGKKYIEELLSYSFLEYKKTNDDHFVIHDLLHDLAEKVSKKQCHRIEHYDPLDVPTTCIHLSLCITKHSVSIAPSSILAISHIFKSRNLRSLIILWGDGSENIFRSNKDIFRILTKLRAMYVDTQIEVLSDPHFDELKHLRYLHVRYDSKLPISLAKLYQLQFFILAAEVKDFYLPTDTLPQGFGNLINLRTLQFYRLDLFDLDYLYYNSKMINIEKLTSLQNLNKFYNDGFNGMISLRNLSIGGSLSILNLENVKCKEEAEKAILNKKKNLNELIFKWSDTPTSIDTCEEVLEGVEPHRNLEKLEINGYQGVKFPKWMVKENCRPRLQTLKLWCCANLKIIPFLPPRLQQLYVRGCDELMQLPPLSDTLHILELIRCPKLQALTNLSPTVTDLTIVDCPNLMPPSMFNQSFGLSDLSFLTNLERLNLKGFPNLQALTNLSPTVTDLHIEDCSKLTSLGNLQHCTSLLYLKIFKCPMLKREEPSLVEGVVEGDIANRLPQVEKITTDEPLLVLELVQQQAFSCIKFLNLSGLQRPFLHMFDEYFHQFSSLSQLRLNHCAVLPNLEKLSSLEYLTIHYCTEVELLPNLPVSMKYVFIQECPKLKEKYEKGGPLGNTISHIRKIFIR